MKVLNLMLEFRKILHSNMPDKKLNKIFTSFNFDILDQNVEAFRVCGHNIIAKLQISEAVPAELILEFFMGYITSKEAIKDKELNERCTKACVATVNNFSEIKGYIFDGKNHGENFYFGKYIGLSLTFYIGAIWTF